ncbi:hypothetical protein CCH79_00007993 [Gambusia affinis]|uniref:Metastasis-associated protein MTA1 R1 domain-containing protein n=1 Tax=Gambusia affinis TaxID=33528 RepID=A0A315W3I8_GAMAF|nr:hypothetical protein CCH79_00007993 [Gambusia affinis]
MVRSILPAKSREIRVLPHPRRGSSDRSDVLSFQSPHGLPLRHSGSPKFAVKTRQAFFLQTTGATRLARRLCEDIIRPRYLARHPYLPVNTAAIKAECRRLCIPNRPNFGALRLPDRPKKPSQLKPVERKPLESVVRYLDVYPFEKAHPRPSKPNPPTRGGSISTGSLTPIKSSPILNNGSPTILGKRSYEQHNGLDAHKKPDQTHLQKPSRGMNTFSRPPDSKIEVRRGAAVVLCDARSRVGVTLMDQECAREGRGEPEIRSAALLRL